MMHKRSKPNARQRTEPEKRRWRYAHELFELTGMSESTINRHVRGELHPPIPYRQIGKRKRVFEVDRVEAWLRLMERNGIA